MKGRTKAAMETSGDRRHDEGKPVDNAAEMQKRRQLIKETQHALNGCVNRGAGDGGELTR